MQMKLYIINIVPCNSRGADADEIVYQQHSTL